MRKKDNRFIFLTIITVVLVNILSNYVSYSFDLTLDNRHSISEQTYELLNTLDDDVYIKVYLDGDFPAGFKHLQQATKDILFSFKKITPDHIEYEFINPNAYNNEADRNALYKQLYDQGLYPTDLQVKNSTGLSSQIIFPGAILYYKNKSTSINFLQNNSGNTPEHNINTSVAHLEFELFTAINHLIKPTLTSIAFLTGNGELSEEQLYDITHSVQNDNYKLSYCFNVTHFDIKSFEIDSTTMQVSLEKQLQKLNLFKAIIIAKPTIPFNNIDKFLIDQYIMHGGKVLWLVDGVHANMDSLRKKEGSFIALKNDLNLDDQLFKYGVRINADLIEDQRATEIPIITGYSASKPQQTFFKWPYYPLLFSESNHPVSRKLDAVKCDFVSSIDTIKNNINKTILLHSSQKSRLTLAPSKISLGFLENPPPIDTYNKSNIPIAVLLEGKFESVFNNRILPKNNAITLVGHSAENKMIVIADGDIIANRINSKGAVYPLGYDPFIDFVYPGNKIFIMNALQYLCDEHATLMLKGKELKLRMLNKSIIIEYRIFIQLINIVLPLLFLGLFGFIYTLIRKKNYA